MGLRSVIASAGAVAVAAAAVRLVRRAISLGAMPDPADARPATSLEPPELRAGIEYRLSRLIRHPTVAPGADSTPDAARTSPFAALEQTLAEDYPLVHKHLDRERVTDAGLLYRWRGRSSRKPLVLMAHTDVVPADLADGWRVDPFSGDVDAESVSGRGALDDKGALVVILDAVENLLATGFRPARDVYLSFGGNEETSGDAAIAAARLFRERRIDPWLVLDEGGAVVDPPFPGIRRRLAMIGVAEKGVVTLRLHADGTGGHASAPPAHTAATRVARAVSRVERSLFRVRLPRPVEEMFLGLAPYAPFGVRLLLAGLPAIRRPFAVLLARLGPETSAMTRTTVAVTMLDGGTAANVLPSAASATLNLRIALGETVDSAVRTLQRRIRDPLVRIEVIEGSGPSPVSRSDNRQFAALAAALAASYPDAVPTPYVMMAATDSRHFHAFAPHVYRFAPLAMSGVQRAAIHGVDEHVSIDSLVRGERFIRALIRELP